MYPFFVIIPLISFVTIMLGSWFVEGGMEWYRTLLLPPWTPSGWVIGLAWSTIFLLATLSALNAWMTIRHGSRRFQAIIALFLLNAILNAFWSHLFFLQHQIGAAVLESASLDATVLALIVLLWPVARSSALLLVPYAVWTTFATYLTYVIWTLNR